MNWCIYDPTRGPSHDRNAFLTQMYYAPLFKYAENRGVKIEYVDSLQHARNIVITLCDHLMPETIGWLKNNNCKIVGFNCTDSSYVAQNCREAENCDQIDLIMCLNGIQKVNHGFEMGLDKDFNVVMEPRQYLPEKDFLVHDSMRNAGRLQPLPIVHWVRQPEITPRPYNLRSQKVILRGGAHARRFILALFLNRLGLMDINSGFITSEFFRKDMEPRFRYCEECRERYERSGYFFPYEPPLKRGLCNSPARWGDEWDGQDFSMNNAHLPNMSAWNNRCPKSFYWLMEQFQKRYGGINPKDVEVLLNGKRYDDENHLGLLSRILFTSDYKWAFSIFAPQRFWDGALAGCINLLPKRTADQDYFPPMQENVHYKTFTEDCSKLDEEARISEAEYNEVAGNARRLYDGYMRPDEYSIGTPLLSHMFNQIEHYAAS